MIRGTAQRRLDKNAWEIAVWDRDTSISYTLEFKAHKIAADSTIETTLVNIDGVAMDIMKGFCQALNEMSIAPDSATDAELKATKFHLEDMRRAFNKVLEMTTQVRSE